MPTWKYTDKNMSKEKAEESLKSIKSACFGCDANNADCAIAKAAGGVWDALRSETVQTQPAR